MYRQDAVVRSNDCPANSHMVRLLGFGRSQRQKKSPPANKQPLTDLPYADDDEPSAAAPAERRKFLRTRKRLVATARSPALLRDRHPLFQYALNEYAQTAPSGTSHDDGQAHGAAMAAMPSPASGVPPAPSGMPPRGRSALSSTVSSGSASDASNAPLPQQTSMSSVQVEPSLSRQRLEHHQGSFAGSASSPYHTHDHATTRAQPSPSWGQEPHPARSRFEDEMPTPAYEEFYADAYTGAPMKYIYPAGYQSMRPRSCPLRLSIVICMLFTWLSIFIVGHCSDQADADLYYNAEIADDTLMIDIRWCGSRPLYLMWVASMLITGVAAAYCGVIGYVKCRDFAVANSRAQPVAILWSPRAARAAQTAGGSPPAVSDYYVRLGDAGDSHSDAASLASAPYRPTIYQADGTPQFWGQQIYRPTQAAVAVTSR